MVGGERLTTGSLSVSVVTTRCYNAYSDTPPCISRKLCNITYGVSSAQCSAGCLEPCVLCCFPFLVIHAVFPAMWMMTVVRYGPVPNDWLPLKTVR